MATLVLTDAQVEINGVDLSDHVRSVSLPYGAIPQDDTAMGDDTRSSKGGLKQWTGTIEFYQDFASSNVDETIFAIVGTAVTILIRPTSSAVSTTNPNFTGTALIQDYQPIGGNVGDMAMATLTFTSAGTLSRATV